MDQIDVQIVFLPGLKSYLQPENQIPTHETFCRFIGLLFGSYDSCLRPILTHCGERRTRRSNTPGMVYRFYVHTDDASDKLSAVYGNDSSPLVINTPAGIFNSAVLSGLLQEGLSDLLAWVFSRCMADDSYATVNLKVRPSSSGIAGAAAPQVTEDPALSNGIVAYFSGNNDGTLLEVNTLLAALGF